MSTDAQATIIRRTTRIDFGPFHYLHEEAGVFGSTTLPTPPEEQSRRSCGCTVWSSFWWCVFFVLFLVYNSLPSFSRGQQKQRSEDSPRLLLDEQVPEGFHKEHQKGVNGFFLVDECTRVACEEPYVYNFITTGWSSGAWTPILH